jgi:hypothetical protein
VRRDIITGAAAIVRVGADTIAGIGITPPS